MIFDKWIKQAERQEDWDSKKVKNGVMLIPPQGDPIVLHTHHSRNKRIFAYRTKLRRAGLDI